jgi:hypothetical protein
MQTFDRADINLQIRERAESDSGFRAQILEDPSAAVSALIGMPIPQSVSITVHEESPTDIHLVIPASSTLNDQDLDLVAGGLEWNQIACQACGCAG